MKEGRADNSHLDALPTGGQELDRIVHLSVEVCVDAQVWGDGTQV